MGHVYATVRLTGSEKSEEAEMLVDTGATLTTIPRDLADRLGVPRLRQHKVTLADGRQVEAEAGVVMVRVAGREAPTTVLILGQEPLLGVETLETLGLRVNPQAGRLEPTRGYAIRL